MPNVYFNVRLNCYKSGPKSRNSAYYQNIPWNFFSSWPMFSPHYFRQRSIPSRRSSHRILVWNIWSLPAPHHLYWHGHGCIDPMHTCLVSMEESKTMSISSSDQNNRIEFNSSLIRWFYIFNAHENLACQARDRWTLPLRIQRYTWWWAIHNKIPRNDLHKCSQEFFVTWDLEASWTMSTPTVAISFESPITSQMNSCTSSSLYVRNVVEKECDT